MKIYVLQHIFSFPHVDSIFSKETQRVAEVIRDEKFQVVTLLNGKNMYFCGDKMQ